MDDQNWKEKLTGEQYRVLRQKGTERPGTGGFVNHNEDGVYICAGCGNELFHSENKFDSGCGWPSFDDVLSGEGIEEHEDITLGMRRVEVTCSVCGGHLGHVFPDGPPETTGLRYCINSVSLNFKPQPKPEAGTAARK